MRHFIRSAAVAIAMATASTLTLSAAWAADISGAGATFPYPIYAKWADAYKKETGIGLNYQSIGSGGGIKQIKAKTVTFGASDAPLKGDELDGTGLAQFPMVMGGIVPVVHRSDGSGTTFNFTYYLGDVSADWKGKVGVDKAVEWPVGIGAKGNEGVANNVSQTGGAIGYVEYAYAKQNKLTYTDLINKDGKKVEPTAAAFSAAAASADWNSQPGYGVILANQAGAETWPMTSATWILVYKKPDDAAATTEALKFFAWSYAKGDDMAAELDYVPMPDAVVKSVEEMWGKDIVDANGKPLYSGM
ncbi:MAG: phosphate ABC transporter substrate-binding protein PstS [Mesorhizobium sp.]|nr:MAG: phosphate ABC transporter substrate-binding protein PstS [Mesorhizobium sp.]